MPDFDTAGRMALEILSSTKTGAKLCFRSIFFPGSSKRLNKEVQFTKNSIFETI